MPRRVFVGGLVSSKSIDELEIIEYGIIGVDENGTIAFVDDLDKTDLDEEAYLRSREWDGNAEVIHLNKGSFLCPGFIDTHTVRIKMRETRC